MSAVEVAVALPVTGTFSYRVPDRLTGQIDIGSQVVVPFGRRRVAGLVMALDASEGASPRPTGRARRGRDRGSPRRPPCRRRCSRSRASSPTTAHPSARSCARCRRRALSCPRPAVASSRPSSAQGARCGRRGAPRADLDVGGADQEHCSRGSSRSRATRAALLAADRHARALGRARWLRRGARSDRARRQARRCAASTSQPARRLRSADQSAALTEISAAIDARVSALPLHGVTGSGKTEVYMQAAAHARGRRTALVLVPRSLTPQLIALPRVLAASRLHTTPPANHRECTACAAARHAPARPPSRRW